MPEQEFQPLAESRLNQELAQTKLLKENISEQLRNLDLTVHDLNSDALCKLIYEQWNPTRPVALGEYNPENVRSSLVFTDLAIYEKGFSSGHSSPGDLTKMLPDKTYASMAAQLRSLPFDSRVFLTIHVPDQTKEIEGLQTQRRVAYSMVTGKRGVSDIESNAKFQDL